MKHTKLRKLTIAIAAIVIIIVGFAYMALCRGFYAASDRAAANTQALRACNF